MLKRVAISLLFLVIFCSFSYAFKVDHKIVNKFELERTVDVIITIDENVSVSSFLKK